MSMSNDWQNKVKPLKKIAQQHIDHVDFAKEIGKVQPIKRGNYCVVQKETPKPYPVNVKVDIHKNNRFYIMNVYDDCAEDETPAQYSKFGQGQSGINKLLDGRTRLVATLDLHGHNQDEAQLALNEFIEYVQLRGVVGKIIHGRGLHTTGSVPKLKILVRRWLIGHPEVLAYTEPNCNNHGVVLVLTKRRKRDQDHDHVKYL